MTMRTKPGGSLQEEVARWLTEFYEVNVSADELLRYANHQDELIDSREGECSDAEGRRYCRDMGNAALRWWARELKAQETKP